MPFSDVLRLLRAKACLCLALAMTGAPVAMAADTKPENVLQELYDDFSWEEGGLMGGDDYLFDLDSASLRTLFDDELTAGILADQRCRSLLKGGCKLDRSPFWASDDPGFRDLRLQRLSGSERGPAMVIRATFNTPRQHAAWSIDFTLSKTPKGWRISDATSRVLRSFRGLLQVR